MLDLSITKILNIKDIEICVFYTTVFNKDVVSVFTSYYYIIPIHDKEKELNTIIGLAYTLMNMTAVIKKSNCIVITKIVCVI